MLRWAYCLLGLGLVLVDEINLLGLLLHVLNVEVGIVLDVCLQQPDFLLLIVDFLFIVFESHDHHLDLFVLAVHIVALQVF